MEGFGGEADFILSGGGDRPTESSFLQPFGSDPEAGSIVVEDFEAVAAFVAEDEKGFVGTGFTDVIMSDGAESVEGFAHVGGLDCEEDFECGTGEVDHWTAPFSWRWRERRRVAMSSAARSRSPGSLSRSCSPSAKPTTSRGWVSRGNSTSAKPNSVQEISGGVGSDVFDMTRANTRILNSWVGGQIKVAYNSAVCDSQIRH